MFGDFEPLAADAVFERKAAALREVLRAPLIPATVAIVIGYAVPAFRGRLVASDETLTWAGRCGHATHGDVVALPDGRVAFDAGGYLGVWGADARPAVLYSEPGDGPQHHEYGQLIVAPDGRVVAVGDAALRVWALPSAGAPALEARCALVEFTDTAARCTRWRVASRATPAAWRTGGPETAAEAAAVAAACVREDGPLGPNDEPGGARIGITGACLVGPDRVLVAFAGHYIEFDITTLQPRRRIGRPIVSTEPRWLRRLPSNGGWDVLDTRSSTFDTSRMDVIRLTMTQKGETTVAELRDPLNPTLWPGRVIDAIRLTDERFVLTTSDDIVRVWDPNSNALQYVCQQPGTKMWMRLTEADWWRPPVVWPLGDGTLLLVKDSRGEYWTTPLDEFTAAPEADAAHEHYRARIGDELVALPGLRYNGLVVWSTDAAAARLKLCVADDDAGLRFSRLVAVAGGRRLVVQALDGRLAAYE